MKQSSSRAGGQSGTQSRSGFRNMAVWQEAQVFAEEVSRLVLKLPRDAAAQSIGPQLIRAAGSIPANIAEGFGRFSQAAYRNHLSIARGSAFESESWVDLLVRLDVVPEGTAAALLARLDRIQAQITTRMKALTGCATYAAHDDVEEVYEA